MNTTTDTSQWTAKLDGAARVVTPGAGTGTVWRKWGESGESGEKPVVLLLHGSSGSWTHWIANIEALADRFTVLVPDLPGNGDSKDLGERNFLKLAKLMLKDVGLIVGNRKITLVGFSFGALLAEGMALAEPERFDRVVLIRGTFDGLVPQFPQGMKGWKNLAADEERAVHQHNLGVVMLKDERTIDDRAIDLHAENIRRSTVRPTDFSHDGLERAVERISCPLVAIRGEFDALGSGPNGAAEKQMAALAARRPDSQRHVVPGAGHWVMYEQPELFNSILLGSI